jgi:hypothetical protein
MWNAEGEHDNFLLIWTLCAAAIGVVAIAIGG